MRPQRNQNVRISKAVESFLMRAPVAESSLVLDGTGMNASYQYVVMGLIGLERLLKLKKVNIVSGSTFAALFFWAAKTGAMTWKRDEVVRWVEEWPSCFGISPITGLGTTLLNYIQKKPLLDSRGLALTLEKTVTTKFANQTVADLPENFRIWVYDLTHERLVCIHKNSELSHMPLKDLVRCATAVPRYFGHMRFESIEYCDPVYTKAYRALREKLSNETKNTLISNMFSNKATESVIYVKPHAHQDGKKLILRDFALFLLGVSSREVAEAAQNGLFDVSPIES